MKILKFLTKSFVIKVAVAIFFLGYFFIRVSYVEAATKYWYNSGLDSEWSTLENNWWDDTLHTQQSLSIPDGTTNVITLGTIGPNVDLDTLIFPLSINATATGITFTSQVSCPDIIGTIIIGNTTFNNTSCNNNDITGDVVFNDASLNNNNITGNATFFGDLSEEGNGVISGTKTRHYTINTTVTRNFAFNRPWTVVADGIIVDLTGATYDNTTTLQTTNNGSFTTLPVIEISSCADFENINNALSRSYLLTVDLNCASEGNSMMVGVSIPFSGTFNGQNHSINIAINSNSVGDVGLFGQATGANISNLIITGSVSGTLSVTTAALVGNGVNLNIENVTNNATVVGGNNFGGIIGYLTPDRGNSIITNTHSNGNISGSGNAGGIIGQSYSMTGNITISNSSTIATITSQGTAGGLMGIINNANVDTITTISNSFSTSVINGSGSIGGLVGSAILAGDNGDQDTDLTTLTITNSYHTTGNITSGVGDVDVGGLFGYMELSYNSTLNLTNSYSEGVISNTSNGKNGGIIGYFYVNNIGVIIADISGNHFSGDITSTIGNEVGGLFGKININSYTYDTFVPTIFTTISISNNYTTGTVSGNQSIGGLIGSSTIYNENVFPITLEMDKNYSTSTVTGVSNSIGGLIGRITGTIDSYLSITTSYSSGVVKGNNLNNLTDGGGIIGYLDSPGISITDSFSDSTLSNFALRVGAMIGNVNGNTITFSNSFFNQTNSGQTFCIGSGVVVSDCTGETDASYFKDNHINAPLDGWNFTSVWRTNTASYPTFSSVTLPVTTTTITTQISQTSATLNGLITDTGGRDITIRGFNYGLTTSYGTNTTASGIFRVGSYSADISSLTCGTTYHFRSYVTNSLETTSSPDVTFDTSSCSNSSVSKSGSHYYVYSTPKIVPPIILPVVSITPIANNLDLLNTLFQQLTSSKSFKQGMTNPDVKIIQRLLNLKGYIVSSNGAGSTNYETNYFGPKTKKALIRFQKDHKLIADGIFGPKTKKEIEIY